MGTVITLEIGAGTLFMGVCAFFFALLAVVWKGQSEISRNIRKELAPFRVLANTITEIQTILRQKFDGINIVHTVVESSGSPLGPTDYGAQLIQDSGLEKILDDNKEFFCTKLKASLPKEYTEYDVQEQARTLLLRLKDDPMLNPVKEWIYDNPINIETILRVGGLWLRDDFLKNPRKINNAD